jgi:hypothetical protein
MAINYLVLEGNLATKPQLTDPETIEFLLYHHGARGKHFGVFYVEAASVVPDQGFLRATEGEAVIVCGVLVQRHELEDGESRRVVKIRALKLSRIQAERHEPPEGFEDLLQDEAIPF